MAEFKKLSWMLTLAGLFVGFARPVQAVPYVSSDILKPHSVVKPKLEIFVVEYNSKGEVVDFAILNDVNTSAVFSLFPLAQGDVLDASFETSIVLNSDESPNFLIVPDNVFDFEPVLFHGRMHLYLPLQVLAVDRRYRLPDIHFVDSDEGPVKNIVSRIKGSQVRGRRGHVSKPRM